MNEPFKLINPEIEAEINYLTSSEGGRSTPTHSGYRADMFYDDNYRGFAQELIGKDKCEPGDSVTALLKTLVPRLHIGKLYVGKEFEIREGPRTVARGKITKILRADFNIAE